MRKIFTFTFCLLIGWAHILSGTVHVVQKNETLGGIAQKYGVSVSTLQAYNGISNPNLLYVGKKLKIPTGNVREVSYVVKKGESLGIIAKRFGVSATDLALINQISRPDLIRVGQKLTIPLSGSRRPAAQVARFQHPCQARLHSPNFRQVAAYHRASLSHPHRRRSQYAQGSPRPRDEKWARVPLCHFQWLPQGPRRGNLPE